MTYGELVWSVSIDDDDFFIYKPATHDFIQFLKNKGVDAAEDREVDLSSIRKQVFVFGKWLRAKLREEYYHKFDAWGGGLTIVFGEAEYVR